MDWTLWRTTVNERASAASGREVEIRGDLQVDLWSWTPEVAAQDVVFGNPSWASEPDMLRVAEVYLKFRLMPIFAGRLEVERLRLVRSEEHTSEIQSLMRTSYAVFCFQKKK